MSKITLHELETFLAVIDAGSLTLAAPILGQPVSTISRTLVRLEEKLQTTLLRRTTRRLDLTDEGCSFLMDARSIVNSVEEAEERLTHRLGQPWGPLRVDAVMSFLLHVLAPIVGGFRRNYPDVTLELSSNEGYVDLIERRVDLAIRFGPLKDSTLHSRLLGHSRLRVVASPAYLKAKGVPTEVSDLQNHEILGFREPDSLNFWPLSAKDGNSLHVQPTLYAGSGEVLRELAANGLGIACISEFSTDADLKAGRLVELFSDVNLGTTQPVHAVYYRNTALSARISSFIGFLERELSQLTAFNKTPKTRSQPRRQSNI